MEAVKKSEKDLLEDLSKGGLYREKALSQLFNLYRNDIIRLIKMNSGTIQDGEDMSVEAMVILDRNVREGKFRFESSLKSYVLSIAKFNWFNQLRKQKRVDYTDDNIILDQKVEANPESGFINEEKKEILMKTMSQLGERCQKVLQLWMLNYSMNEIADQMDLSSEGMARKTKYQCFKKLKEMIRNHPELENLLK